MFTPDNLEIDEEVKAKTKEEKAQAKKYAKKVKRFLNELKKEFNVTKGLPWEQKVVYNLMQRSLIGTIEQIVKELKPEITKKYVVLFIGRLRWIIQEEGG